MGGPRFERFSERARRVLSQAQEEAQRFNHSSIGTEHLLLGLARQPENVASRVLVNLGVELAQVSVQVELTIGRRERSAAGEVGLTPRAKKVIELAVDEARRLNHHYIGTAHLLIGLLREGERVAAGVLESLGVDLEKARAETTRLLAEGASEAPEAGEEPAGVSGPASPQEVSRVAARRPGAGRGVHLGGRQRHFIVTGRHATSTPITGLSLVLTALFITVLMTANITAVKLIEVGERLLPAAIVIFPVAYVIGDILTEVYGYRYARRVIWLGFLCNFLLVAGLWVGQLLPPFEGWDGQAAYERILGYTPRILAASFSGYLLGEFTNAAILARMKVLTRGRWLWSRTVASTIVGEGLDSLVFITVAFAGVLAQGDLVELILTQWTVKVVYEALATPLLYVIVGYVKGREGIDVYDAQISFNPLALWR